MAFRLNRLLRPFGIEIHRFRTPPYQKVASLTTDAAPRGDVLLAYIVEPFLLDPEKEPSRDHTNHIESMLIARTFLTLGYNVDIIDYRNSGFMPAKDYSFFVSVRTNFETIANRLNADCVKIAHLDTAHFLFNNSAAYARLLALQQKRGVTTSSMKVIERNWAPEHADYLTILGNDFTLDTYRYANKPMFRLSVPTPFAYPSPVRKDFEIVRKRFLWFGSGGLAHKGLGLTLEAFADMADHHLTVCGPVDKLFERHFRQAYFQELYETSNIRTVGWVDVGGDEFLDVASDCAGIIYPSCAEGQSGAVVTCMQVGLIPLVSCEAGVDVHDFGVIIDECTIKGIKRVIRHFSNRPAAQLRQMSIKAWEYARANHTQDRYLQRYLEIVKEIMADSAK